MTQIIENVGDQGESNLAVDLEFYDTNMASIPYFKEQEHLFTNEAEKSRVEFLATRGAQIYNQENRTGIQTTLVQYGKEKGTGAITFMTEPGHICQLPRLRVSA